METNARETLPLVTWRGRRRWTQRQLASAAGLSLYTVRWIEIGRTTHPYPRTAKKLADALGLPAVDAVLEFRRAYHLPGL